MYIYGRNAAKEYLTARKEIKEIVLQEGFADETVLRLLPKNAPLRYATAKQLTRLTNGETAHQGIALRVNDFQFVDLKKLIASLDIKKNPVLVMLDGVQDPRNLGAIIRTCDAIGVKGVIIPERRAASITPVVAKVAVGATSRVPIAKVTNLNAALLLLKKAKFWVVGTALKDAVDYRFVDYKSPLVVVLGNEGDGISRLVLENCDFKVKLPMLGTVDSLNVSVAAGILLYRIYDAQYPA